MRNPLGSLAARVTLLVFVATVASSLTVSWIAAQSLDRFLRQKVDERFPEVAGRIAHELDQWYMLRSKEIEVFAGSAILVESAPKLEAGGRSGRRARNEAEQYLEYVLESFPQFQCLALTTPNGKPAMIVGHDENDGPADKLLPAASLATEVTRIGDARREDGRLIQFASTPLRDGNGRIIARLHALLDHQGFETILRSEELGETATIFLVDRDRRYLDPPPGASAETEFKGEGAASELTSSVTYYDDPSGLQVVGTKLPFPRFGWTLVIEQPYDEAFAPIVSSIGRVMGLNIVIVLAVGLAAFRIAGSIVRPLRALSDAARRLSEGERGVEIEEAQFSAEEVNVLTRTFNEMSRGLARNARELEDNQREIESTNQKLLAKNEELSNMNLVLEQLSITDGLTKLHNHRYFQDALTQECKRSARTGDPLCLILVDIDYFKKWNDRLGHAGGDEILRRMAEVLNQAVRETDLLARYGGEEFALLAIDTDLEGASALGEKIRQSVAETDFVTDVPSEREKLTVSVGVASFSGERKDLFGDADEALYSAKDGGRNRVAVAKPRSGRDEVRDAD